MLSLMIKVTRDKSEGRNCHEPVISYYAVVDSVFQRRLRLRGDLAMEYRGSRR